MKANTVQSEILTIPAGEFKAKCLKLMDEAVTKQQRFSITKRGKVVGEFVPAPPEEKRFRSIFGRSPDIRIPSDAEWKKLKGQWADEVEASTEKLARQIGKGKNSKR